MFSKTNAPTSKTTPTATADTGRTQSRSVVVPSILSKDVVITGEIKTDGDVQIEGRLDGNIKAASVTIGEHGAVNGKIDAQTVFVRGKVTGKIVGGSVDLSETANVQADIVQDHLTIANGAFFDGKCSRKTAAPTSIKEAKKSA